ncbi:LTA synthase family protein [Paenibacillus albus]|uniref:LTA synthase family protein n=1 Tax=Paenibacillus albus TaxID=2495582 RepID=A0A3S9A7W5_9BACL|nr:LTA synthase family protein [Paenibacillus albus]AZN41869.1 LTA synthase family protein [Paenibacillus albus]
MSYLPLGNRRELLALNRSNKGRIPLFYIAIVVFVLKMALLRHFLFSGIEWSRVAADLSAVLVILSLVELITPARLKKYAYGGVNLIYSLILFSSAVYFEHFGSVPTYTALYELHQVTKIKSSVESTIQYSHYLFFADIAVALIIAIVAGIVRLSGRRAARRSASVVPTAPMYRVVLTVLFIVSIALSARFIQLGMPIQNELVEAEQEGFLNYQVSAVIKAERDDSIASEGNTNDIVKEVNDLQASYPYKDKPQNGTPAYFGTAKGKNVIIIQMEAFQNFPIHLKLGGQEVTPVLNKLAGESLYFPHIFQQIGQGNTSDAEFMSNTSIYPTAKIAMSTGYGDRAIPSLPRLLQKFGYNANTFHVNDVTFWDRNKLYAALNFDHYYDKPNYKNDHFNSFGASDEELYRVATEKLTADKQPFYGQLITVSSHFPFDVPEHRVKMKLPDELKGTQLGNYLLAVNYTDYAIGTLIDRLKADGLWDDTVLVLYGDHFGLQPNDNDPEQVSKSLGVKYDPKVSRFNIPLIIHVPGEKAGKVVEQVGGQLDIMPTVANLLGISLTQEKFTAFGHDLLNIDHNVFGMRYYLPTGSFFNNDILFVPGQGFDDGTAINIKTLEPVTDLSPYRKDYDYVMKLMTLSDRYVKSLPKR